MRKWAGYMVMFAGIMLLGMVGGYISVKWGGGWLDGAPVPAEESAAPIGKVVTDLEDDMHESLPPSPTPTPNTLEKVYLNGYLVRTEGGEVCVFRMTEQGEQVFMQKLAVQLSALREDDRARFDAGFAVASKAELAQLIEDFSS